MHHQGYLIKSNEFYQYKQSATRMEINGRNYLTGISLHINIIYLFTKNQMDKGELRTTYCPTHLILEDYFTKLPQGYFFHKYQDIIMGRVIPYTLIEEMY